MNRINKSKTKIIVFFVLTLLVLLIIMRITLRGGAVRDQIILEEQFRYYEKIAMKSQLLLKNTTKEKVEEEISSYFGSSFSLPAGDFIYFTPHKIRAKKVTGLFVPFRFEKELYLMGIYSVTKGRGIRDKYFLDGATLLSGEKGEVSFIVFETQGRLKVSLISIVTVEELFRITRNYFMEL